MARTRYTAAVADIRVKDLPAAALRAVLREGYHRADFKADLLAGLVVGIVALPLAMALAIGVGVPPQHGLYTAIVAGALVAALGGSRTQVTGPTAAFIVILAPIYTKFGMAGLLISGAMGGLILIAHGAGPARPVHRVHPPPGHHRLHRRHRDGDRDAADQGRLRPAPGARARALLRPGGGDVGGARHRLAGRAGDRGGDAGDADLAPAAPEADPGAAGGAADRGAAGGGARPLLSRPRGRHHRVAAFTRRSAGGSFDGMPPLPPLPMLPWHAAGPGGAPFQLNFATLRALLSGAFAVAMLGGIESLLSAVIADGMAGTRHDPDAELLALGIGNVVTPFFGGIPATGAIARTATNIRSGARSPIAAIVHAATVLLAVLVLAPLIGYLPMAALAALLLLVAWNMSEVKHFVHIVRVAPRSDVAVLLICFGLTVVFDMVVAVAVGVVLAALLFMRRMADITQTRLTSYDGGGAAVGDVGASGVHRLPDGLRGKVAIYDIAGPLFFGAAQRAMSSLGAIAGRVAVVIIRLEHVPVMDATGLVALESALIQLSKSGCVAILVGLQAQPQALLEKALQHLPWRLLIKPDLASALAAAEELVRRGDGSQNADKTLVDLPRV